MLKMFIPDKFIVGLCTAVLLASFLPVQGNSAEIVSEATNYAVALLFFLHGAKLGRSTVIQGLIHWRLHLVIMGFTFVVFPLLGLSLELIPSSILDPEIYAGFLFLCVLPSTVQSSIAFTSIAGGNVPAAVCSATVSNILGIFITPVLVGLLFKSNADITISLETFRSIIMQLLLPFIIGQIFQPVLVSFFKKYKTIIGYVDRGSILLVVYSAFSDAVVSGLWQKTSLSDLILIGIISSLLLTTVLFMTCYGSRFLKFNREDEIAIIFCGSKKTLASGVPMASVIFAGQNIGAIILPLMIFHQIQLMVCAFIARHYASKLEHETSDGGY